MKCVAVESTPSMVESFSDTNAATLLQACAVDEHQQIVAAGHEVARFHLVEPADALGEAVEAAAAFGRDAHLDDGADDAGILVREVQHRADSPAARAAAFSSSSWRLTSASDRLSTCAICAVFRLPPSSNNLTIGFIGRAVSQKSAANPS